MKKISRAAPNQPGSVARKSGAVETGKGWGEIKLSLTRLRRDALIGLLHDLYELGADNRAFLHARFGSAKDSLEPYMKTISRWVNPDPLRKQDVSISRAKKAISDYKKAIGRQEGIAELMVYFCRGRSRLPSWLIQDIPYYDALGRMFERALIAIENLGPDKRQPFIRRLENVAHKCENYGYGIADEMHDRMLEYEIHSDDENTDSC